MHITRARRSVRFLAALAVLFCLRSSGRADTYHVATTGSDSANGSGWGTALATISNGVAKASAGDTVLVSNGTYTITAQIVVDKGITITSVNGQDVTDITAGNVVGVRCFNISHADAVVNGFTIRDGHVNSGSGAGIYMTGGTVQWCTIRGHDGVTGGGTIWMTGGLVQYCRIRNNDYNIYNGTIYMSGGTLRNCLVRDNTYRRGGGVYAASPARIENCTVVQNSGGELTGGIHTAAGVTVINTITYYNVNGNYGGSGTFTYTCTTPTIAGTGNISDIPQFVSAAADDFHLLPGSPCTNAASTAMAWMATGTDLDGNPRVVNGKADMGCYQMIEGDLTGNFSGTPLSGFEPLEVVFTGYVTGTDQSGLGYLWDFDNNGTTDATGPVATNVYNGGLYDVSLTVTNAAGESNTYTRTSYILSSPATIYVSPSGSNTPPYDTWAKAATAVQTAINAGVDGALVLVTNGTYVSASAISLSKGITVRSVNGRAVTTMKVSSDVRALSLTHADGVVDGFTMSRTASYGAGVAMSRGVIQNCDILDGRYENTLGANASMSGGTIRHCNIRNGSSRYLGGINMTGSAVVEFCEITGNRNKSYAGTGRAGGVVVGSGCTLRNCLVMLNTSVGDTAGVANNGGTVDACTIVSNSVESAAAAASGGLRIAGTVRNCIVRDNVNAAGGANTNWYYASGTISHSCTTPDVSAHGSGNIAADPLFVSSATGLYQLQGASPCVDAGTNQAWMVATNDLGGNPRITGSSVDMGAYEVTMAVTNLAPSPLEPAYATLRGQILYDGGAGNPDAFICWGTNDWGTAGTSAWPRAHHLGADWTTGQTFGTNVTGLVPGIGYVYRCMISNAYDTAWADPAEYFWTSRPAVVTNLGATAIGAGSATLQAEVTDTGGDAPDCWLHYWITGSASTSVVAKGEQSGVFSQVVSGLTWGSNYSYAAFSSNVMGTSWSDTKSFRVLKQWHVTTNGSDAADGESWATALATISNAVARGADGDIVLVSNGVYSITAPIVVDKAISLRSVNGQTNTVIDAANRTDVRCMEISHAAAVVEGFTIKRGYRSSATGGGAAGIYMTAGTVQWCTITECQGYGEGGSIKMYGGLIQYCKITEGKYGHYSGTVRLYSGSGSILRNCLVANNYYRRDAGIRTESGTRVENCTVVANNAGEYTGGIGAAGGVIVNTIVYFNTDPDDTGENYSGSGFTYSCSTPLPTGTSNIVSDPLFVDMGGKDYRLLLTSPCREVGTTNMAWLATGTDLDGNARMADGKVDMGCYQFLEGALTCSFEGDDLAGIAPHEVVFTGDAIGSNTTGLAYLWDFESDGTNDATGAVVTNSFVPGLFSVSLTVTNAIGESNTYTRAGYVQSAPAIAYVAAAGSDTFPYDTWGKAAHGVQSAINAGVDTTLVLVTNGTFSSSSTLNLTKGITLRSVNGRAVTALRHTGSVRTLYVSHTNALVDGFSITRSTSGGGVQIHLYGVIENCDILNGNWAHASGANASMSGGVIRNCTLSGGRDRHIGGVQLASGGALVENCIIRDNANTSYTASDKVGGVSVGSGCTLRNCLVVGNSAVGMTGGAVNSGTMENCTVVDNSVNNVDATAAGGVRNGGTIRNGVIVDNVNDLGGAYTNWYGGGTIEYTCTIPDASALGVRNTARDPLFEDAANQDYRLTRQSPCINTGLDQAWMVTATDLNGSPRLLSRHVDMGAYEAPPYSSVFFIR